MALITRNAVINVFIIMTLKIMNCVSRRQLLFANFAPRNQQRMVEYLPKSASFEKELSTESFRFNIKVSRTEDSVVKMERVEWYDPITGRDMSKNISELYILDSQEM